MDAKQEVSVDAELQALCVVHALWHGYCCLAEVSVVSWGVSFGLQDTATRLRTDIQGGNTRAQELEADIADCNEKILARSQLAHSPPPLHAVYLRYWSFVQW